MCSVQGVANGGWIPAAAALGGRDAIGVESVRDRGQAPAGRAFALDPLDQVGGDRRGPAEASLSGKSRCRGVARASGAGGVE